MFKKIFDHENGFWRGMSKAADAISLNLLFMLCCIPVITIGASASAFYYNMMKLVKDEETYIIRGFFKAFKENFKKATIIWIIMFVLGAFLLFDCYLLTKNAAFFPSFLRYIIYAITFVYALMLSFVFALQARFENSVINTIKNSLFMGIGHFLPWGVIIVLVTYLPITLLFIRLDIILYIFPLLFVGVFAFTFYINSKCFLRIFKRYTPKEPEEDYLEETYYE